jgi:hypothetical protein
VAWVKWKLVSVCSNVVLISTQDRSRFAPDVPQGRKFFWSHPMEQLGDVGQMDAHFSLFGDNVSQVQDCCTVCTEHAIGSKIVFGASDGTPR